MRKSIQNKLKQKNSSELLNIYINSGGKKASYDDVADAVKRERVVNLKNKLKLKYGFFSPVVFVARKLFLILIGVA